MSNRRFDVVIVGAGFSGLYLLKRLREAGFSAVALEAASGVGGTWWWNRYPGARCDVESLQYGFSFDAELQQGWSWSERYAAQPEILRYAEHVAERFDLKRDILFEKRVAAARFREAEDRWTVETEDGDAFDAGKLILATGCLSVPNEPTFDGLEGYGGAVYHTGRWPHEDVDFSGMRVGVIGTGSSAIQSIPQIAKQAAHLTVFQRTPNYAVPAHNAPMDRDVEQALKADYESFRTEARKGFSGLHIPFTPGASALAVSDEERRARFEERWGYGGLTFMASYLDLLYDDDANATARDFVREKIRAVVDDPATANLLCPTNVIGCKRLCVDIGYYETFNRPNVSLIDAKAAPIERFTETGLIAGGVDHALDAVVFATGFDAMTGAILRIDVEGRDGRMLREKWAEGPKSYLGLMVEGFPNLFTVTGPGSPSVLTNMIMAIEHHVDWIMGCLEHMRAAGGARIEATAAAEEEWVAHNRDVAGGSLRSSCSSWYVGANVAGKPRVFMPYIGGFPAYVQKCADIAANGYEGFEVSGRSAEAKHDAAALAVASD